MRKLITIISLCLITSLASSQNATKELNYIKARLDSVEQFKANMILHADIAFIQMPDKSATVTYKKGEEVKVTSENFTLIPKRGLDFTFKEIFEYPYLVVERAPLDSNKNTDRTISILPQDDRAEYSIATLQLDTLYNRISTAEISTKKDGTYKLQLIYPDAKAILPVSIRVSFEMDRIRIPLNFAGNDVVVDRKKMRDQEIKTGAIILTFTYSEIIK